MGCFSCFLTHYEFYFFSDKTRYSFTRNDCDISTTTNNTHIQYVGKLTNALLKVYFITLLTQQQNILRIQSHVLPIALKWTSRATSQKKSTLL